MTVRKRVTLTAMFSFLAIFGGLSDVPALAQGSETETELLVLPIADVAALLLDETGRRAVDLVIIPLDANAFSVRGLLAHEKWPVHVPFHASLERSGNGSELVLSDLVID